MIDLARASGVLQVRKKRIPVEVVFALAPGTLQTIEGPVRYRAGDALLTAVTGERWPVSRAKFLATYEPAVAGAGTASDAPGAGGHWLKRPIEVLALRLEHPYQVRVGGSDDPLLGHPGDWLVQYGRDPQGHPDQGIVSAGIFEASYERLDAGDAGCAHETIGS